MKEINLLRNKCSTFAEIVQLRAKFQPDKEAFKFLVDDNVVAEKITYKELHACAKAISDRLRESISPDQPVILMYPPGLDFVKAFIACMYVGIIAVPTTPPRNARNSERAIEIIRSSDAPAVLGIQKNLEQIKTYIRAAGYEKPLQWIKTDSISCCQSAEFSLESLSSIAFLQYTSGSIAAPKGVVVGQENLLHNLHTIKNNLRTDEQRCHVSWLPAFHDLGLIGGVLNPIFSGHVGILMSPNAFLQRPVRWLKALSEFGGTISGGPNFAYQHCIQKISSSELLGIDLSLWNCAFTGAEPILSETLNCFYEKFKSVGFSSSAYAPCYGLAESTLMVTSDGDFSDPKSINVSSEDLEQCKVVILDRIETNNITLVASGHNADPTSQLIRIVDSTTKQVCEDNEVGEIWVSSPSVAHGYWKNASDTEAIFRAQLSADPSRDFLRTGDLGFLNEGSLYVTGRQKDLIIVRGRNLYPQDIETLALSCSVGKQSDAIAASFGLEVESEERVVVILEVDRHTRMPAAKSMMKDVRESIAQKFDVVVHKVVLLKKGGIPRTTSGKVQRQACRKLLMGDDFKPIACWENAIDKTLLDDSLRKPNARSNPIIEDFQKDVESWIATEVSRLAQTGLDEFDVERVFSDYALDSLALEEFIINLETWLGVRVDRALVWDYPTAEKLSIKLSSLYSSLGDQKIALKKHPNQRVNTKDIAIIGMASHFPGARNVDEYWRLIEGGGEAIIDAPSDRGLWNNGMRKGGFIDLEDGFDTNFFGVSPSEAENVDPQQGLLLEVSWAALESANIVPEDIRGTNTGVFIGISSNDFLQSKLHSGGKLNKNLGTGSAHSIAANRLSYFYDFKGPSMAVDTACSSSLVATHLACQSLIAGESSLVIVGGVNFGIRSESTEVLQAAGMLSPQGKCFSFDKRANGFVRGEGAGIVVLKRLEDALFEGDEVLAVIKGSAVTQDGQSNGLTAPNGLAQQQAIKNALSMASVEPCEIEFVETHGTGTALGDPIEVTSIKQVLGVNRSAKKICALGTVKPNIGHLEAAAGIAGLIKTVLAIANKKLPPNINFELENPLLALSETPFYVPTDLAEWSSEHYFSGVSSFGFGGTNAHLVLSAGPKKVDGIPLFPNNLRKHILTLSAKTPAALRKSIYTHSNFLNENTTELKNICYTANTCRTNFRYRSVFFGENRSEIRAELTKYLSSDDIDALEISRHNKNLAFLFSGQGTQYPEMGRLFFENEPKFREAIDECDSILTNEGFHLVDVLYGKKLGKVDINSTEFTQPVLFSVEYALSKLWRSCGVYPSMVMGHSLGEYVAACTADVMSLSDALSLVMARGRLMSTLPEGGMLAVRSGEDVCRKILESFPDLDIAAVNSDNNCVVSGGLKPLENFAREIADQKIVSTKLNASRAFHSPHVDTIFDEFRSIVEGIALCDPKIPMVSNVTGNIVIPGEVTTPNYWAEHMRKTVHFSKGIRTLFNNTCSVFLELGPSDTLLKLARIELQKEHSNSYLIPTMREDTSDLESLIQGLAELSLSGIQIDWEEYYSDQSCKTTILPGYCFE